MAINKNFVVKHGLEVKTNLLYADAQLSRVGIGTTLAYHKLHVNGDVKIENTLQVVGVTSLGTSTKIINGTLEAGNTGVGTYGQFLVATGAGIAWTTAPNLRKQQIFTAFEGQQQFNFAHTIGFLDVFVNGVKLSTSEYIETAAFVTLLNGCTVDDTVELIGYYLFDNIGAANTTGIQGITVLEENAITGTPAQVTSINFVGANVTAAGTGAGVTVRFVGAGVGIGSSGTQIGYGFTNLNFIGVGNTFKVTGQSIDISINSGNENYWVKNEAYSSGIVTTGRVGIGSTLPSAAAALDVDGIIKTHTLFANKAVIDQDVTTIPGYNNFGAGPITIASGKTINVLSDSTFTILESSGGAGAQWTNITGGLYNTSLNNIGIATVSPRFYLEVGPVGYANTSLWVNGNARVTGILTVGSSSIILDGNDDTVTADKFFGIAGVTFPSGDYGLLGASTTDPFGYSTLSWIDLLQEPSGIVDIIDLGSVETEAYSQASWLRSTVGIHTLSNVGIGTTNPTSALTVVGSGTSTSQLFVTGVSTFVGITTVTGTTLFAKQLNVSGVSTFSADATIYGVRVGRGAGAVSSNTVLGRDALTSNTTGVQNTAVGDRALGFNTTGYENTAIGAETLYSNTTGNSNTAIGYVALYSNTTGNDNTAIGLNAFYNNTVGNRNTVTGVLALPANISGNDNIATGYRALFYNTTGSNNIAIGGSAGYNLTNGSNNTIIGSILGTAGLSDTVIIGAGSTERLRINSSGNVGIGTTNPTSALTVVGSARVGINTSQGVILTSPNGTKYQLFVEDTGVLKTIAV